MDFDCNALNITFTPEGKPHELSALGATVQIYGIVGLSLLAIFELSRGKRSVYGRRLRALEHRTPPPPSRAPLAWLKPVLLTYTDAELQRMIGLDGYVALRYIRWCFKVCLFMSAWGCAVLLPVYASSAHQRAQAAALSFTSSTSSSSHSGHDEAINPLLNKGWARLSVMQRWTMDSLEPKSSGIWWSASMVVLYTLYALFTMHQEMKLWVGWRGEFLARGDPDAKGGQQLAYSVLVEDLPRALRSDVALLAYFEELWPGQVHSAKVQIDCSSLEPLLRRRAAEADALEAALAAQGSSTEGSENPSRQRSRPKRYSDNKNSNRRSRRNTSSSSSLGGYFSVDVAAENSSGAQLDDESGDGEDGDYGSSLRSSCLPCSVDSPCARQSIETRRAHLAALDEEVAALQGVMLADGRALEESVTARIRAHLRQALHVDDHGILRATSTNTPLSSSSSSGPSGSELEDGSAENGSRAGPGPFTRMISLQIAGDLHVLSDGAVVGISSLARGLQMAAPLSSSVLYASLGGGGGNKGGRYKSSTGFVTFKTRTAAAGAASAVISPLPCRLAAQPAPDPRAMVWPNSHVAATEARVRTGVAALAVFAFGVFGFVPTITAINGVGNVSALSRIRGLEWMANFASSSSFAFTFFTTQLPVLLQVAFVSLLPYLWQGLAIGYEKKKVHSEVQRSMFSRGVAFQLVQIYATLISNSLSQVLYDILARPGCTLNLLGAAIPATATYFAQLVVVKALSGLLVELSRPTSLLQVMLFQCWRKKCGKVSAREKQRLGADFSEFQAGWVCPSLVLVVVVALTFAVLVPGMPLICASYFALAYAVYGHQLLFVYIPSYESGGALLPALFGHTLTGMSVANLTMLGYVVLKEGWGASTLLLAPLVPLIEGYRAFSSAAFGRPGHFLSREAAARADRGFVPLGSSSAGSTEISGLDAGNRADGGSGSNSGADFGPEPPPPVWASFDPDLYRQPALDRVGGLPNDNGQSPDTENDFEDRGNGEGSGGGTGSSSPRHLGDGAAIGLMAGAPVHSLREGTSLQSRQPKVTSPILQLPRQEPGTAPILSYQSIDRSPVL